ncbi:hypothetical protein EVAR_48247_1 [Eumeta japonica]|uniref:Uncharacterized protein n=1 Tax=Eumeta variegata TaxID=151549 RepID=A0A4C1YIG1_EUMVA|nr:hypothetical protein EVAR_48247_1 [Eumeta japonica]
MKSDFRTCPLTSTGIGIGALRGARRPGRRALGAVHDFRTTPTAEYAERRSISNSCKLNTMNPSHKNVTTDTAVARRPSGLCGPAEARCQILYNFASRRKNT